MFGSIVNTATDGDLTPGSEATGDSFALREWSGSGPRELHVHHADDEAWCVFKGRVRFRLGDRDLEVGAGSTVFVPAGVAHTFVALTPSTRYLLILTKRLVSLIASLDPSQDLETKRQVYRAHASELLE